MSGIVQLLMTPEEAATLRAAGIAVEERSRRFYRGPAWVEAFIRRSPNVALLGAAARAIAKGADPDAVHAAYALGGERAVEDMCKA